MIELERHIEILLLDNDCVIVPGLGGFMTHHVDAAYDEEEGVFFPPLRTLGFNPQLTMNDSLLVQSYIEAYDISYPEAQRRIEGEVVELRQRLDTDGSYELNDIGTLKLNDEGHLEFMPCEAGILTPALYGLSSFSMPLLNQAAKKEVSQAEKKEAFVKPEVVSNSQPVEEMAVGDESPVSDDDSAIVIKMSWIRNAVAVAVAILAFFLIQTPVSNSLLVSDVQQSSIVPLPASRTSYINNKDKAEKSAEGVAVEKKTQQPAVETAVSARKESAAKTTESAIKAKEPAEKTTESAIKAKEPAAKASEPAAKVSGAEKPYCIVLASQTSLHHAELFIEHLKKEGHKAARIVKMRNSERVRVVYGAYNTQDEAQEQLRSLRVHRDFTDAWVLKL